MTAEHALAAVIEAGTAPTSITGPTTTTKGAPAAVSPVVPAVSAVVEMNLEEYPAFRLGRRSKRPELRYTRTRTDAAGRTIEQLWVVRGAEGLGLPGPFEQDLYVALLVLFTEQGLPADGRIRFTRNRLTQLMDISNSGRGYELIEQGLYRLAGATVQTEHAFYRPLPMESDGKRSGPTERLSLTFHILEEVRVYERRAAPLDSDAWEPDDSTGAIAIRPRVEIGRPFEVSVARLGQPLVQSFERRYTKHLDTTFYFTLTRPLAKRLYRYVDKVRNGRGSFEIGLRPLADVLGLEYRYPSDIKDGLQEAHAELREHGYLLASDYAPLAGGPSAGEKVVYAFDPAFDQRPRRRAGAAVPATLPEPQESKAIGPGPVEEPTRTEPAAPPAETHVQGATPPETRQATQTSPSPLRAELEAFGISPRRATALVEAFPEAHIATRITHVRTLMDGKGSRTLRNPAGYLARAIEFSYAVAPATQPRAQVASAVVPPPQPSPAGGGSIPATAYGNRSALASTTRDGIATSSPLRPTGGGWEGGTLPPPTATTHSPMPEPDGLWGELASALRSRLSGAAYAAWVAPIHADEVASEPRALKLIIPSVFSLDRWHRPPIAPALAEAAAALGITVTLEAPADS